jgi:hypothetical protein
VLIDSLSFGRTEPGRPWLAYRQFCEHFLAPLALMARVDVRLGRLLRDHLEGVPLDLAARLLPGRSRFSFGLGPHIFLHARAQRQHAEDAASGGSGPRSATMSPSKLATLVESLRSTVTGLTWEPVGTEWADYAERTSYGEPATAAKEAAVARALDAAGGTRCWTWGPTPAATAASPRSMATGSWPSTWTRGPSSATTAACAARAAPTCCRCWPT